MACSGGDDQVAMQHKRALRSTIFVTAETMGAAGIVTFLAPLLPIGHGAPLTGLVVHTVLKDASGWLLGLAPVGGALVAGYHWFMSGPGSE